MLRFRIIPHEEVCNFICIVLTVVATLQKVSNILIARLKKSAVNLTIEAYTFVIRGGIASSVMGRFDWTVCYSPRVILH